MGRRKSARGGPRPGSARHAAWLDVLPRFTVDELRELLADVYGEPARLMGE